MFEKYFKNTLIIEKNILPESVVVVEYSEDPELEFTVNGGTGVIVAPPPATVGGESRIGACSPLEASAWMVVGVTVTDGGDGAGLSRQMTCGLTEPDDGGGVVLWAPPNPSWPKKKYFFHNIYSYLSNINSS